MVLKFVYIIILNLMIWRIYPITCALYQNQTIAQPDCISECGNVSIPYPFGMHHPKCFLNEWFEIECRNRTSGGDKPYLRYKNLEVIFIHLSGVVGIKNPICRSRGIRSCKNVIQLGGSPFVYSQDHNSFVAVGCQKFAVLNSNGSSIAGCLSMCDPKKTINFNNIRIAECRSSYCCDTSLPSYLSEYNVTIGPVHNVAKNGIKGPPASALIIADYSRLRLRLPIENNQSNWVQTIGELNQLNDVPAVLQWEILNNTINNSFLADAPGRLCNHSDVTSPQSQYEHSGWTCSCIYGFEGNPYIAAGCKEIKKKTRAKWAIIGVFSSLGTIILLLGLWWLHKVGKKRIAKKRREKFFKKNGGLLLVQRLSCGDVNAHKIKLFSLKDLENATAKFNINRVLGKGGQGTVYKGMLEDGKDVVAVKKFKVEGNTEEFINEFVILSQINHRNVVKLLGCCLETEIPLLVYEFIPNGNLFEYLHAQNEDLPMTWDMRLRIAIEVAGALFYLHSRASRPIYHRDIKSTNILLDGKYKAKVADFGASRMVSTEATHLTTAVQGTYGYLDPEYHQTGQLTEKSDVYSFGVVLVELLTGQKPTFSVTQQRKTLSGYFLLSIEENRLLDIVDERVMKEGETEHILIVANLARRCLDMNGKNRPTMKEVTLELESIQKSKKQSAVQDEEVELAGIED